MGERPRQDSNLRTPDNDAGAVCVTGHTVTTRNQTFRCLPRPSSGLSATCPALPVLTSTPVNLRRVFV